MTQIIFVRHAEPVHSWKEDRTRPLTPQGIADSKKVTELLKTLPIDCFYSSPYVRSLDTILESSLLFNKPIVREERFRERQKGEAGNEQGMFQKRWADFTFCESGGESLQQVQQRNIEALLQLLHTHNSENVVVGTHGTALSTILNYYNPSFGCDDFLRIIDYMPYVILLSFDGTRLIKQQELLFVEKEFTGKKRAEKA